MQGIQKQPQIPALLCTHPPLQIFQGQSLTDSIIAIILGSIILISTAMLTSVYSSVAASIPPQNSLLLLAQSLNMHVLIAQFILKEDPRTLCIFIDFEEHQLIQINSHAARLSQKLLLGGEKINAKARLQSINLVVSKRKLAYQSFGFYSVSAVVFTLDLLCNIVHPALISRIFIKRVERVKTINHNYAWILEMAQRESANCRSTLICRQVSQLSKEQFMKIYEIFCVKKVVVWPFGRKQIFDAMQASPSIEQLEHNIPMSKVKGEVQNTILGIMKQWSTGIPSDRPLIQVFTKQLYLNINSTRAMMDLYQLRILLFKLVNQSYANWLISLYRALNVADRYSFWATSNQKIDSQIEGMKRLLFHQIFTFKITEEVRKINITKEELVVDYDCKYQMDVIAPYSDKINQLFTILETLSSQVNQKPEQFVEGANVWVFLPSMMKDYDILGNKYSKQLQCIYTLLKESQQERNWHLRNISKRAQKTKVSNTEFIKENEVVLLEELSKQLQAYQVMSDQHLVLAESTNSSKRKLELFQQFAFRVQSQKFRYIDHNRLKQSELKLSSKISVQVIYNQDIASTNVFRAKQPDFIIFYSPSLRMLRNIYLMQSELTTSNLKSIHIINIPSSIQDNIFKQRYLKEDANFWEISKLRPTLPTINTDLWSRVNKLESKTSKHRDTTKNIISEVDSSRLHLFNLDSASIIPSRKFYIIIDKREFKSQLPAVLFHYGFEVVPMFLTISDYILTDDMQVERKQVTTHDLHNSLRTGRLESQLKSMSAKVKHPYLLIEFSNKIEFDLKHLMQSYNRVTNETYRSNTRRQVLQLLKKYPKVMPIWSQGTTQTAELFFILKENRPEPDIGIYSTSQTQKQESELNVELVSKAQDQIIS